jgi:mannose-6-phosphate isomerase-like protein (cupin superfamily)
MQKVNLGEKFSLFHEFWTPKTAGELNGQYVKFTKTLGEFAWHKHANEDEFFLDISGSLTIKLKDQDIHLQPWEFFIVPKGLEHKPVSESEAHVLVFEPKETKHTGDTESSLPVKKFDLI